KRERAALSSEKIMGNSRSHSLRRPSRCPPDPRCRSLPSVREGISRRRRLAGGLREREKVEKAVSLAAMIKRYFGLHAGITVLAVLGLASAQPAPPAQPPAAHAALQTVRNAVREYRQQHEAEIVRDYARLLALPNVASDTSGIRSNAESLQSLLQSR